MKQHRIDSPIKIDPDIIARLIKAGIRVIVQYPKSGYSAQQLTLLNELAKTHGRNLEIRFYGHYSEIFDASILQLIPDVQCLSIDCLTKASNLSSLSQMHRLVELNLGVFELEDANILNSCNLKQLNTLSLGETKKCNIDLIHLSKCMALEHFHTTGQTKNISTICSLPSLCHLSLASFKKKDDLEFVSSIHALKGLRIILGGRRSIAALSSGQLQTLEIIRVQGLEDVGDLGRFERLEGLLIEDQVRLAGIKVSPNPRLRDMKIINCKTLENIFGIGDLDALLSLRISRTAIDYEKFVVGTMPNTLQTFAFYTSKSRRNAEIHDDLKRRGFCEFSSQ